MHTIGSFACPYCEAVPVAREVTAKIHLYTVKDLEPFNRISLETHRREAPLRNQLGTALTIGANAIAASPTTKNRNIKPN
jgi:hypothetical protein